MEPDSDHWQSRFKCEQILEVGCPRCGAKPHAWCDRAADKLSKRGHQLLKAGTPPSHQERMWTRQGHAEREFPALLAKQRPGCWDEGMPRTGKPSRPAVASGEEFVPSYPIRYTADRICPECGMLMPVEVVVQAPQTVGYRCDRGHKWLTAKASRPAVTPPKPVLAGKTGCLVVDDIEDRPPWDA